MWDLLTLSDCIRSPPFTPSSPLHQPNSPHPGGEQWWRRRGEGRGRRFFWLNAAFANIRDYIVSTGVKYRHEMHQFNPLFTDSRLVRPSGDVRKINPVKDFRLPASFCWIKALDVLKVLRTTPESSTWMQLTQSGYSPQDSPQIRPKRLHLPATTRKNELKTITSDIILCGLNHSNQSTTPWLGLT